MGKRETDDAISSAYDAFKCKFQRLVLTKAYVCQEISYNVRLKCWTSMSFLRHYIIDAAFRFLFLWCKHYKLFGYYGSNTIFATSMCFSVTFIALVVAHLPRFLSFNLFMGSCLL